MLSVYALFLSSMFENKEPFIPCADFILSFIKTKDQNNFLGTI
jgi:hypothetical protein